jgi:hypothetical protein
MGDASLFHYEKDYADDFWRWLEIHKTIIKHKVIASGDPALDKIQADIVAANDPGLAYFFALDIPYRSYKMQEVVLKTKSAKYAFLFALLPGSDLQALQSVVLNSNKLKYICRFACYVPGAAIKKIQKLIIQADDAQYAHLFLKNVKGASLKLLKPIILRSEKPRYLYALAERLSSRKEVAKIEDLLIALSSWRYIRLLAQNHPKANIPKLEQAIIDAGNAKELKLFAKAVKSAKSRNLSILF